LARRSLAANSFHAKSAKGHLKRSWKNKKERNSKTRQFQKFRNRDHTFFRKNMQTRISTEQNRGNCNGLDPGYTTQIFVRNTFLPPCAQECDTNAEFGGGVARQGCEQILAITLRCGCMRMCETIGHKEMLTGMILV